MSDQVRVSCIVDPNYYVTHKAHEKYACFAESNPSNRFQVWHRKYDPKKTDASGHKAFALINACSGKALKYVGNNMQVTLVTYAPEDDAQLWITASPDDTQTLEPYSAIGKCLTADLNDEQTIDELSELEVSSATEADNQVWKVVNIKKV